MSDEPSNVFLITKDGEEVPCLLELVAFNKWQATPVRAVSPEDVQTASIDVLPAGASMSFVLEPEGIYE